MIILAIRTDKPDAEVGLWDDQKQLASEKWESHRILAVTLNKKIKEILNKLSISAGAVQGVVVFQGPGSFTGLRIGLTVANALAYAHGVPIVARGGNNWLETGIKDIKAGGSDNITMPEYGSEPYTTQPRK